MDFVLARRDERYPLGLVGRVEKGERSHDTGVLGSGYLSNVIGIKRRMERQGGTNHPLAVTAECLCLLDQSSGRAV